MNAWGNPWCVKPQSDCVTSEERSVEAKAGVSIAHVGVGGGGSESSVTSRDCQHTSTEFLECQLQAYNVCMSTSTKEQWLPLAREYSCHKPKVSPPQKQNCVIGQTVASGKLAVSKSYPLWVVWEEGVGVGAVLDISTGKRDPDLLLFNREGAVDYAKLTEVATHFSSLSSLLRQVQRSNLQCTSPESDEAARLGDLLCKVPSADLMVGITRIGTGAEVRTARVICK
jgi:hypothetical protein